MIRLRATVAGVAWALLAILPATAGLRVVNHGLHAVPAPGLVKIDGDLAEWDLSGAIASCRNAPDLLDTESVRTAAMWSTNALYLAFIWRDETPMRNPTDPALHPDESWQNDCVQIRFALADLVSHMNAWYYAPGQRPSLFIHYGRYSMQDNETVALGRPDDPVELGAKQAFQPAADGKGYVQELRIPWTVLTRSGLVPESGAALRIGFDFVWGRIRHSGMTPGLQDNIQPGAVTVDRFWERDEIWGPLTLMDSGNLPPRPAPWETRPVEPSGPVSFTLNLKQDAHVTVAIEDTNGNRVCSLFGDRILRKGPNELTWSGLTDTDEPCNPGEYRWVGIAHDGIRPHWLMSFNNPNPVPWRTADGTGGWGPDHGYFRCVAALPGGRMFLGGVVGEAGDTSIVVTEDGRKLAPAPEAHVCAAISNIVYCVSGKGELAVFDAQQLQTLEIRPPGRAPMARLPLLPKGERVEALAATGDALHLLSLAPGTNLALLRAIDPVSWTVGEPVAIPDARRIAAGPAGILVAFDTGIRDLRGQVLLERDLTNLSAFAIAPDGSLWLASGGSPAIVCLRPGGAGYTETVRIGGRPVAGPYDPTAGVHRPSGLALDSIGRLWVTERTQIPKRVSVWKEGRFVREFIGGTGYGGGGHLNPLDPTEAYYGTANMGETANLFFRINLDDGSWRVERLGIAMPQDAAAQGFGIGTMTQFVARDGIAYLVSCRMKSVRVCRKRPDGQWALCVAWQMPEKGAPKGTPAVFWNDMDDDFEIDPDEVTKRPPRDVAWSGSGWWGARFGPDLSFYSQSPAGKQTPGRAHRPVRFTVGGTPVYDPAVSDTLAATTGGEGAGLADGSFLSLGDLRRVAPAGRVTPVRRWFPGRDTGRWTHRMAEPGILIAMNDVHGLAPSPVGDLLCIVSDQGQRYLLTDDALYVTQLFQDSRSHYEEWPTLFERGFDASRMAMGQESFYGGFVRIPDGRHVLTAGFTDCRVFEIRGLDALRRLDGGTLALQEADLPRAREIQAFRRRHARPVPVITVPAEPAVMALDGLTNDWSRFAMVPIRVDRANAADVLLAATPEGLAVAWLVSDPTPLTNRTERWEHAFKEDAVDLMFRPPGGDLDADKIRNGDLRLLITRRGDDTAAVLFRPVSERKHPFRFDAFEGADRANAHTMDEVRLAPEVRTGVTIARAGYTIEALVPWNLLGMTPNDAMELRMDLGVLFGAPEGGRVAHRAYWSNRNTTIVSDIPSEARLQPADWGIAHIEPAVTQAPSEAGAR